MREGDVNSVTTGSYFPVHEQCLGGHWVVIPTKDQCYLCRDGFNSRDTITPLFRRRPVPKTLETRVSSKFFDVQSHTLEL